MTVRERKNNGPQGPASVQVLSKNVRVSFDGGDVYDLPVESLAKGTKSGKYIVSLSSDKSKILGLRAIKGQYIFSFKQMGGRVNDIPASKIQRGGPRQRKDGKGTWMAPDEHIFTAIFRVESEGLYKGLTTSTNLPYSFTAPANGSNCDFYDSKRNLTRLETFLRVVGNINMAMAEIPYYANPSEMLIWLEKYLQKNGQMFLGNITDAGFLNVDDISTIPFDLLPKTKKTKKGK